MTANAANDLTLRKELGRAHLNANHLETALSVFAAVARDYPGDPEAAMSLGDFYLAAGDANIARLLYQHAHGLDPRADGLTGRLQLAGVQGSNTETKKVSKANLETQWLAATQPEALNRVLEQLDGRRRVQQAAVERASAILRAVVASTRPALAVQQYLAELDALLPALLQLNAENAQAEGRPDLATAIKELQVALETETAPEAVSSTAVADPWAAAPDRRTHTRLLFMQPNEPADELGPILPGSLETLGCDTVTSGTLPTDFAGRFDALVVRHPHTTPQLLKAMAAFSALGQRVVVELGYDCEALPAWHLAHAALGLTTSERATAYTAALRLADVICVPSEALAASLRERGYPAQCLPPAWTETDPLPPPPTAHDGINLGWIAGETAPEDAALVRRTLAILLHEFPEVRLVIGGDAAAYRLFAELPAGQTIFLPVASPADEARALALCDVLLVPLRDTPFHRTLSDARLLQAGRAGVPWIASPIPAFSAWQAGGLLAGSPEEWYTQLRSLVMDAGQRQRLAEAGRRQADTREMGHWARAWLAAMVGQ